MPRRKVKKKRFNTLLDEDLYEFLQKYAETKRISMTQVVVNYLLQLREQEGQK